MYKNKFHKKVTIRPYRVATVVVFYVCLLVSCARSRGRTDASDVSDAQSATSAGFDRDVPDGGLEVAPDATNAGDGALLLSDSGAAVQDPGATMFFPGPPPTQAPQPPAEVEEAMESLGDSEFQEPLEELAKERCGYIFKAQSTIDWVPKWNDSSDTTKVSVETRVFDSTGRLVAAELEWNPAYGPEVNSNSKSLHSTRRLQIDYDQNGRPIQVRISPAYNDPEKTALGSVIKTEYQNDGSSQSLYVTDEVELAVELFGGFGPTYAANGFYFCDWLRFDRRGNLIDRKWDCNDPRTVQARTYDDRGRLLSDHGFYFGSIDQYRAIPYNWTHSMQRGEWRIDLQYDDTSNRSTVVWLGPEESSVNFSSISGMTPSDEPVEHRVVRSYDDSGQRLFRDEYDHENDGVYDEQVYYTYQSGELTTKEVDFWIDGVTDIIEKHIRSANDHRIERRNMTANADVMYSSQKAEDTFMWPYYEMISTLPPQSQSIIEFISDEQSRLVAADLEIQWIYHFVALGSGRREDLVSESWHEESKYADQGYVSEKEVSWEPSEAFLEAQQQNAITGFIEGGRPYLFDAVASSTTCTLTPLCDNAEVVLPEDRRLLACEVGVVFSQYRAVARMPSLNQDDLYTIPPYDRLPGMQKALRRSVQSYAFPRAPFVQDIMDYP